MPAQLPALGTMAGKEFSLRQWVATWANGGNKRPSWGMNDRYREQTLVACFERQQRNIKRYPKRGTFSTYEQMCDQPAQVEGMIQKLVPALTDFRLSQQLAAKQYNECLRNMNNQQLERLGREDVEILNAVFAPRAEILHAFGYDLISASGS